MRLFRLNQIQLKGFLTALVCAAFLFGLTSCNQISKANIIRVNTNQPWNDVIGYSQVTELNGTVYLSGVACSGESYAKAVPDCYRQLKVILDKLKLNPKNIIKETIFTKDIEGLKEQIPARKAFYNGDYPAATWIQISRLYLPEMMVEVDAIAVRTE